MTKEEKTFNKLVKCISELGWDLAVYNPSGDEDAPFIGMSMGTPEYLDLIEKAFEKLEDKNAN